MIGGRIARRRISQWKQRRSVPAWRAMRSHRTLLRNPARQPRAANPGPLAAASAGRSAIAAVFELQRSFGNQAVQLLAESGQLQAKLRVGQPNDVYEREADRLADQAMQSAPSVQRQCAACAEDRPCPKCEEEKKLQRKTEAPAAIQSVREDFLGGLGPGQALASTQRDFFESSFGCDFGGVRIHADGEAAHLARSISALAFTVGDDIVFGAGQYSPDTQAGRRLLAHELVHTIQQSGSAQRSIQRAVSKKMDKLRDLLTRGLFDWVITDANAHDAIVILKALSPADLKDTVAAMEQEGLVDNLFSNVSDDDQAKETDTLERIHNVRVHTERVTDVTGKKVKKTVTDSCAPSKRSQIDDRLAGTKEWARQSKNAADDFVANPAAHAVTGNLLDRHFFHQTKTGALTVPQQQIYAGEIRDNFDLTEKQAHPFPAFCASPFDPSCGEVFLAYVSHRKQKLVLCNSYFGKDKTEQTYHLLHEFTHQFADVDDRGYGDERIFSYLTPPQAINNADSYALFALDVAGGGKLTSQTMRFSSTPRDDISDCALDQAGEIRRRFAYGARMILNALNIITDEKIGAVQANTHFKTTDRAKLKRVIERFTKLKKKLQSGINFECEGKCDLGRIGYRRKPGWTVHICPDFFGLAPADLRTDWLLLLVIMEELGMSQGVWPGSPGYANQSVDKAYDNAAAYVGYARDVTTRWWP